MSKEIWISCWDELYNDALDAGHNQAEAALIADSFVDEEVADCIAAKADRYKDQAKERGEWPPK